MEIFILSLLCVLHMEQKSFKYRWEIHMYFLSKGNESWNKGLIYDCTERRRSTPSDPQVCRLVLLPPYPIPVAPGTKNLPQYLTLTGEEWYFNKILKA